jgi:hypothetical protein
MKKSLLTICSVLLVAIIAVQSFLIASAFHKINILEKKVHPELAGELNTVAANSQVGINFASHTPPAISVKESKVYLPELKLQLPLNDTSLGILYATNKSISHGNPLTLYDVSTRSLAATPQPSMKVTSCTDVIQLRFETKADPFNTNQKSNPPIKLADGRTLQVYTNTDPTCSQLWNAANVKPAGIAQLFQQATSY